MAFPTGWGRKCAVTIDYTKVGASLSNFPMLITQAMLPSEMFDADGANPALNGGGDIRFSSDSAGTTQLAIEVVKFVTDNNPANGVAEIWVKIPSLSNTVNTTIYVWYKKSGESQPTRTDTYGSDNVWNSNYRGVYHMAESSGNALDSASGQRNLTDNNTVASATGKIGDGRDFESANTEYFSRDNDTNLGFTNDFTLSCWIKLESTGAFQWVMEKSIDGSTTGANYRIFIYDDRRVAFGTDNSTDAISTNTVSSGTWYHIVATKSSTTGWRLYVNNSLWANNASKTGATSNDSSADVQVGRRNYTGSNLPFDGVIDELRIINTVMSDGWISTEYNNQNSPSTFATAGTPESGGGTAYTKSISETSTNTDTVTKKQTAKRISEASTYTDVVRKAIAKLKTEASTWSDTIAKTFVLARALSESASWTDIFSRKQTAKRIAESATYSDSLGILKTIGKLISETATYTAVVSAGKALYRTLTESSTYTDLIAKTFSMGRLIQEALSWTQRLYGKKNGVNMKYFKKYAENVGTYVKKYFDI